MPAKLIHKAGQVCASSASWACVVNTHYYRHAGLVALQNLPADNVTEAAIAAALLLEHAPRGVAVLLRPGALRSLVAAVLDENAALPPVDSARTPLSSLPSGMQPCTAHQASHVWLLHRL